MTTVSSTTSSTSTTTTTSSSSTSSSSSTTDLSSIDWDGLIEEAVQAKLDKADAIDLKITNNEAKISAYESLQSLLADLVDATDALRAPSGYSKISTDVFQARTAYLTATGDVDASSTLSATVEDGADTGSYSLTVSQLAKSHKVGSDDQDSKSTELGYDGVISIGTEDGDSAEITIESDMTLAEIAEAINGESDVTGVQASVLQVTSSSYRLILSTTDTGETISASSVSGDDVLNSLGLTDEQGDFADVLQESQQAVFTLDGVTITRSTNDIDDVLDGVTLHLYQTTPDETSITIEIGTDLSAVKDAISAFVDAYNAYRDFIYEQQQIPTDENVDTTVLFGDSTVRSISTSIGNILGQVVNENALGLLGLTFDSTNNLELDEDTLDDALLSNLDDIKTLLAFQMDSSSSKLLLLARGEDVPDAFTLDITVDDDGTLSSVSVDGDDSLFTISGTRIVGNDGTAYEGFSFVYTGKSDSVDVSFSSGIAEQLHNISMDASDDSDGTLQELIDNLSDIDDTLSDKSDAIREAADTYKTNLTNRYAKYQAAIATAQNLQDYLTSLVDSWNSSS